MSNELPPVETVEGIAYSTGHPVTFEGRMVHDEPADHKKVYRLTDGHLAVRDSSDFEAPLPELRFYGSVDEFAAAYPAKHHMHMVEVVKAKCADGLPG